MILNTSQLSFAYHGRAILRDIDFQVAPGELTAILGPNGVGKTTLLKCINTIHQPHSGIVEVEGRNVLQMAPSEIAARIGYVPQRTETTRLTLFDAVLLGRIPHIRWTPSAEDLTIVNAAIQHLRLEDLALRPIHQLSGGELQKVCIARALVQEPSLLLLDEPTSALDLKNQVEIMGLLRRVVDEQQIGAVMTMHDLNKALRYADSVIMLKDGQVAHCGPTVAITAHMIEKVYDLRVEIHLINGYPFVVPAEEEQAVPSY